MSKPIPYLMLGNAVSLTLANGDNHVINSSHPNFGAIVSAIKGKTWDVIEGLIDIPKAIAAASGGKVTVNQNEIRYNGLPVHSYLASRILELLKQGFDISPWTNFMEKLYTNPDPYSITQLYTFLERAKLPLTPDGDFLAYKYVRKDFKDAHTGTMDNSIGQVVWLDRAGCDNNPDNHCSRGLHFCSKGYLPHTTQNGSYAIVLVKVNPRDVVSVPNDHNCEKARTCRYEVVGLLDDDYSIEDMEAHEVLPTPGVEVEINKPDKKTTTTVITELQKRVVNSTGWTVREIAKNLGVKQSDIVNSAGKYYKVKTLKGQSIGESCIEIARAGLKFQ
jgi:hypothetical protein